MRLQVPCHFSDGVKCSVQQFPGVLEWFYHMVKRVLRMVYLAYVLFLVTRETEHIDPVPPSMCRNLTSHGNGHPVTTCAEIV